MYLWPDHAASKKLPPLVLRLVVANNGKHPVYLVTNVLSQKRLTNAQVITIYSKRWGIEVHYRHFKQTFQKRKFAATTAKMRGRTGMVAVSPLDHVTVCFGRSPQKRRRPV